MSGLHNEGLHNEGAKLGGNYIMRELHDEGIIW